MSSGVSLISWGEGTSLALVPHPSRDGVTIKILYGVDVLLHLFLHLAPIFFYWLVKTECDFIVRLFGTGLARLTSVVAVISVDAYHFFAFLRHDHSP